MNKYFYISAVIYRKHIAYPNIDLIYSVFYIDLSNLRVSYLIVVNFKNLNYNSNTFIYPKTFFDKVYTSNSIRNNTIKYDFNLFNNRI